MKNKGISLIVLIITIVVIIILATAIIVNIAKTNIIGNANEAVVKQDFATFKEELDLYIADKYTDTLGKYDTTTLNANTEEDVVKILSSVEKSKYSKYVTIANGKIVIKSTMPEPQRTWAMEVLNEEKYESVAVNTKVEGNNATISGKNPTYSNPVIPVGFKAIETEDATWQDSNNDGNPDGWNNGLVIQDESGNEFVWVPVDGTNLTYTKRFDEYKEHTNVTDVLDDIESISVTNENTQITKYGGFYIGRYESGVPANQTEIDGISKDTSNKEGIPVVKQGSTVWSCIDYVNANTNAKSFVNTTNVKSGLVTGTAWDSVCAWINNETDLEGNAIHDVTNSSSWGNYLDTTENAQYDIDGITKISGDKQTTGKNEYWKAKNIYDIAGNMYEWTGETYSSMYRIIRGGYYDKNGSDRPASCRFYYHPLSSSLEFIAFRIMLYVI